LDRTGAASRERDDFVGVEAAVRLAEEQPQDALLRAGEERIGQADASALSSGCGEPALDGHIRDGVNRNDHL
jgi:electron transfer flavoprotein alpha/beta subunit